MPFMKWEKTSDGYKPVEITDEEMEAQNAVKKEAREKAERIREQLEIVNDKNIDRIKDSIPVPKVEPVNCKDCDDTVCCERGKDKLAYCPRCFETKKEKKMEFDRSRIYSAVNADELRAGDKVIVADQLSVLKQRVQEGKKDSAIVLQKINGEDWGRRFGFTMSDFALAYLVERKENCLKCKKCEVISDKSMHCDWVGTGPITSARVEKCNHYEPKTGQKEMCLNCKHYNKVNDFRDCTLVNNPTGACPHYEAEKHYRPFKDTDELIEKWWELDGWSKREVQYKKDKLRMPLIWVRYKANENSKGSLITGYDSDAVYLEHGTVHSPGVLFDDYEFLDGSPCGVEE